MKRVLIFNGSPRTNGNTSVLIHEFIKGCNQKTTQVELFKTDELDLDYCKGCLRCNILQKCSNTKDDWHLIAEKIMQADVIVFASPVYFHHVTAQLKKLIDRFRSFIHVQINEIGLIHTPVQKWNAELVLMLVMGSPDDSDADPAIEMFRFIQSFMTPGKELHIIKGTRLAVSGQVKMTQEKLELIYNKMNIPENLAEKDYKKNQEILKDCYRLGQKLTIA